jgi:hypothetical protein
MSGIFDRLNSELEQFGRKAQAALDEGKLRLEFFRLRREQDDAARELGRLVHRRDRGGEVDPAAIDGLMLKLDQLDAEITRVERAIASVGGEAVSVADTPAPAGSSTGEAQVV